MSHYIISVLIMSHYIISVLIMSYCIINKCCFPRLSRQQTSYRQAVTAFVISSMCTHGHDPILSIRDKISDKN